MSRFISGAITAGQGCSAFEQSLDPQVRPRVQVLLLNRAGLTLAGTSAGRIATRQPGFARKGRHEPLRSEHDRNRRYGRWPAASAMPPHRDRDVPGCPRPPVYQARGRAWMVDANESRTRFPRKGQLVRAFQAFPLCSTRKLLTCWDVRRPAGWPAPFLATIGNWTLFSERRRVCPEKQSGSGSAGPWWLIIGPRTHLSLGMGASPPKPRLIPHTGLDEIRAGRHRRPSARRVLFPLPAPVCVHERVRNHHRWTRHRKREAIEFYPDDVVRHVLEVTYQYVPTDTQRTETGLHQVDPATYDRLRIGSPVKVRPCAKRWAFRGESVLLPVR